MPPRRITLPWLGCIALLLGACQTPGLSPIEYEREVVTPDGLVKIRTYRLNAAYLRPGARLGGYSNILIEPVQIAYESPPSPGRVWSSQEESNFELSPRQTRFMREGLEKILEKTLSENEIWTVVENPSPRTLRLRPYLIDLVVAVPPDRTGRNQVYLQESAEMTLILDVSDAETRQPLARLRDRRMIRPGTGGLLQRAGTIANAPDLRAQFAEWARLLEAALEDLHALPQIPPLPRSGERGRDIAALGAGETPGRMLPAEAPRPAPALR